MLTPFLPTTHMMRLEPLTDSDEITYRVRDIVIGAAVTVATALSILLYFVLTPAAQDRWTLAVLCGGAALLSSGLFALPRRRLVASRRREPLFMAWSALVVAAITACIAVAGDPRSPIFLTFILPLVFAAISYPVAGTAIVGTMTLVAAWIAGTLCGQSAGDETFTLLTLGFASVMGVWQADGRATRRAQLDAEHRRAQRYLDVAGTMIIVLSPTGRIDKINAKACAVLGYSEAEATGRDWFELAVPAAEAGARRDGLGLALTGAPGSFESEVLTRAGERRRVKWHFRAVEGSLLISGEDVTEQLAAQERVAHMAYHDALTGLANRVKLEEHLAEALVRARRRARSVALLYIDLDHFKIVNDTLGHGAGDELLRQVAARLDARVRAGDVLARHGGDEFMLLLSDLEGDAREQVSIVARDLLAVLEEPFELEGHEFEVAASVGAAVFPDDAADRAELLKRADGALYQAKHDGRGTIRFNATERVEAAGALTLTARLRRALARDEFELHYQPVFDVAGGAPVAVEALLRWRDPEHGMIAPGAFIPAAEGSGLIEAIGDWVLDTAVAQAAAWRELGLRPDIAFNVAPRQLTAPGFAERLLERLADADRTQFIAEITESAAMADPARTLPLLERLAAAGVRIAIDDFGADFSSLSRLRDLPVHELKIDRSFLRGVPHDPRSAAIVTAIVQLAQALELTAVAEGVELPEQLEFLALHGCTLAQGFHLARPLEADAVTRLLLGPSHTGGPAGSPRSAG